jgi:hypothetical protein
VKSLKLSALLVFGLACGARPLSAQQVVKKVVLDSVQKSLQNTLYALRDSLQLVDAATSRLERDRKTTSDALLQSRARLIAGRCEGAGRMSGVARETVKAAGRPAPDPKRVLPALEQSLVGLASAMATCATEFHGYTAADKATELRDYGVGRGAKVRAAIRLYQPVVGSYFEAAIGDRYVPNTAGAGATPTRP